MVHTEHSKTKVVYDKGPMGFVLFVAWVGALVYFEHDAIGIGGVLWAFLESIVWPGIVLYHVLQVLGA
jgi:hypothetical protein